MNRAVNRNQPWMSLGQTLHRSLAAMRRPVVHNPEHPASVAVWGLAHDLLDQPLEGGDARCCFAAPKHLGAVHVEGGKIGPSSSARILVLDAYRLAGPSRQARMGAYAGLDAGLLVSGDDKLVLAQRLPLPAARIQVQDAPGFCLEVRIARKYPAAMLPWTDRVLVQPPPDRATTDAGYQPRVLGIAHHIGYAQSGQRHTQGRRKFAGKRLDLNGELWGKRPGGVPGGLVLRVPLTASRRSACATG